MKISLYNSPSDTTPKSTITVDKFLHGIRYGEWKAEVEKARSFASKEERDNFKKTLPAVTISGVFSTRKEANLISHSGFICVDIDSQEVDRSTLAADPFTYALFYSISGKGVAILVKINPDKHKESYQYLQKYYFEKYGVVVDPAPKNVASCRIISYDPEVFVNPGAKPSKFLEWKLPKVQSLPVVFSQDELTSIVRSVIEKGIDLAPDYLSYLQLAFALSSHLGESGRQHFHTLCQLNSKYSHDQADRQYTYCLKSPKTSKGIGIGTFYHMVKSAGIDLPKQDSRTIQIAAIGKKSGRTKEAVAIQLHEINMVPKDQAERIATEVFSRPDISLKTLASDPEHLIESLVQWMNMNHPMKKNCISERIENNTGYITGEKINTIYLQARSAFNTPQINKDLIESIIYSDFTPTYNPFEQFYQKNASLNSSGHISDLIASVSTPTSMAATFIRKWLISLHAAIDGHPVRTMLVLVGPQFNGKTEFFRNILPRSLQSYYAESKLDRGKDDELLMCQKIIVMDDEMGGKSKQDEKRLKELTSKNTFSLRAAYRRDNQDYKRLAVLCGTSNPTEIMNDPTGNTRILPVYVQEINFNGYNSVDKDALFMESYRAYMDGEVWQLTKEDLEPLNEISSDFSSTAFEREMILQFFRQGNSDSLTATEIKNEIEINSKQQIRNMTRFGIELRKLFGDPKSVKRNGIPMKCYSLTKINASFPRNNDEPPF